MKKQETINDYFESDRITEFIDLLKKALINGWEYETGKVFQPCNVKFNKKRGRLLVTTYEAIKYQKVDLYLAVVKQLGAYIAKSCSGCVEYSNFIIDEEKIMNKQWERAVIYVYCN